MTGWKDPESVHNETRQSEDVSELLDARTIEQVRRQVNVLEEIYANAYLCERLVLGGASALLYVHFESAPRIVTHLSSGIQMMAIPRVTADVDADYHFPNLDLSYEEDRKKTESVLRSILERHGVLQIRKNERSLNLDVQYKGEEVQQGTFKVEINFMRRYPVLGYIEGAFKDPVSDRTFLVKTYPKEQAFANKWRTMISRNKPSDIFDVYHISQADCDRQRFMRCAVLECMLELQPRGSPNPWGGDVLHRVLGLDVAENIKTTFGLSHRPKVYKGTFSVEDLKSMRKPVIEFSQGILSEMTEADEAAIERFFTDNASSPRMLVAEVLGMIDPNNIFDQKVYEHPQLYDQIERRRLNSEGT